MERDPLGNDNPGRFASMSVVNPITPGNNRVGNLRQSVMPQGGQIIMNQNTAGRKALKSMAKTTIGKSPLSHSVIPGAAKPSIFGNLVDDAHLPMKPENEDEIEEEFHEEKACEFCQVTFGKLRGISRHHCRRCFKSVCDKCSNNKRRIYRNSEKEYRVCDFCDTQISNFRLEESQESLLKAQADQMKIYISQLTMLDK
jgi:hypothetical protein